MANENLLPSDPAARQARQQEREDRPRSITCGYCECVVARDGGVIRTSDRAKDLNRQEDRIDALKRQVAKLETELSEAIGKLAVVEAATRASDEETGEGLAARHGWAR